MQCKSFALPEFSWSMHFAYSNQIDNGKVARMCHAASIVQHTSTLPGSCTRFLVQVIQDLIAVQEVIVAHRSLPRDTSAGRHDIDVLEAYIHEYPETAFLALFSDACGINARNTESHLRC